MGQYNGHGYRISKIQNPVANRDITCTLKPVFHCDAKFSRWSSPPTREFRVGDTNMLISKNAKICVTYKANAEICVFPQRQPLM